MSTTIAVMNKHAVALASDSFHTLAILGEESGDTYKTFHTVNKLFKLSDTAPVGIIQFESQYLMDVPLGVIFAMYKDHLGKTKFNRLEEYVMDFIKFLQRNPVIFPGEVQEAFLREQVSEYFKRLTRPREAVSKDSGEVCADDPPIPESMESKIEKCIRVLSEVKQPECFPETFASQLLKKRQQLFDEVAKAVFEESQLSGPIRDSLRELGGLVATRAIDPSISCGIAFVGYGEQDIFPNLIAFWADGVIDGRLRYWRTVNERVDRDTPAHVITFGDDEMIETFLYGVNPHYLLSLVEIPDSVKLFGVPTRRDTIITSLPEVEEKLDALVNKFSTHRAGIIKIVSFLRQADLAKTAEEMVKLECLRQRFSEEHEFTGGPVDVALITKSGFTWVKHETRVESGSN